MDEIENITNIFYKKLIIAKDSNELSLLVDKFLIPKQCDKKMLAEVSTPHKLRQDMLDLVPEEFWKTPKKVFEPCSGKGGFLVDIVNRFIKYLDYKTILEECLYFSDINPVNIYTNKLILDPENLFKLNYNLGNTLELDIKDKWGFEKFDLIISNPPYNGPNRGERAGGATLWQLFVKKSLNEWLKNDGLLVSVHPPGWRKPEENADYMVKYGLKKSRSTTAGMYMLMTIDNSMLKLFIRNASDGKKMFNCGTKYDYYLIQKKKNDNIITVINDDKYNNYGLDLSLYKFLINSNFNQIDKLLYKDGDERLDFIYSRGIYSHRAKHMSYVETEEFKYPCIHSINIKEVRYLYSSIKKSGFSESKIIFGSCGLNDVIIDMEGKYGITDNSYGVRVESIEEALLIKKVLLSFEFKEIMKSCLWGNFRIEWKLFTHFKKNFYKEFT